MADQKDQAISEDFLDCISIRLAVRVEERRERTLVSTLDGVVPRYFQPEGLATKIIINLYHPDALVRICYSARLDPSNRSTVLVVIVLSAKVYKPAAGDLILAYNPGCSYLGSALRGASAQRWVASWSLASKREAGGPPS